MNLLKNEFLKLKGLWFIQIVLCIPLLFILIGLNNFLTYKSTFLSENPDIWEPIYEQSALLYGLFLLPALVSIVMSLLVHLENKNGNLERMLSLPIKKSSFYLCKFFCGYFLIFINLLVFTLLIAIFGYIFKPANTHIPLYVFYRPILTCLSLFPVMAIQYYLSFKFSNVFIPIIIGIFFTFLSVIVGGCTKFLWLALPWSYSGKSISATHLSLNFSTSIFMYLFSLIITLLFTFMGITYFNKKTLT